MTNATVAVISLMALMKIRGIGRRGALRIFEKATGLTDPVALRDCLLEAGAKHQFSDIELNAAWLNSIREIDAGALLGITAVALTEDGYPERLRRTPDPPAVLFIKGNKEALKSEKAIAIVGTREPTKHGAEVAIKLGRVAVKDRFVVVSGLAHGCDTYAHQGCIKENGIGIAVLAHGLDRVYPAANRDLAQALLDGGGCIVSEYAVGATPVRTAFAERDRIQSGLADGVMVIETDVKGGTMHTVRFAEEQKRPLACVQHKEIMLDAEKTRGNQMLIREKRAFPVPDGKAFEEFLELISRQSLNLGKNQPQMSMVYE